MRKPIQKHTTQEITAHVAALLGPKADPDYYTRLRRYETPTMTDLTEAFAETGVSNVSCVSQPTVGQEQYGDQALFVPCRTILRVNTRPILTNSKGRLLFARKNT